MKKHRIIRVIHLLSHQIQSMKVPAVGIVAEKTRDPYCILISCLLSLRTKDAVTDQASRRLLSRASTPGAMLHLKPEEIERLIYPVGFYRTKAKGMLEISKELLCRFEGKVPNQMEDLLSLKGVGRKTANLVMTLGFHQDGICVDTHVHRISNRLGWVKTKNPYETEKALMAVVPKKYWRILNDLLVTYGQNICRPISPKCSLCVVSKYCPRVGVLHYR